MSPAEWRKWITSHGRRRPDFSASIVWSIPRVVKSRRKELPVPSGKKPRAGGRGGKRFGKEAVHNFVGRAVAADRKKISEAAHVGIASECGGFAAGARLRYFQLDSELAYAFDGSGREGAATSATRGGIDDGEKARAFCWLDKLRRRARGGSHSGTTASRPMALRICSASSARFTFMDAVRGKSAFQTR